MVSYRQIQREPASSGLFNSRITTMEGFNSLQNEPTAFIALDTEHFAVESEKDRLLHQVGLAYIPHMVNKPLPQVFTRLQDFHDHSQAQVLTLNINIPGEKRDDVIRIGVVFPPVVLLASDRSRV